MSPKLTDTQREKWLRGDWTGLPLPGTLLYCVRRQVQGNVQQQKDTYTSLVAAERHAERCNQHEEAVA